MAGKRRKGFRNKALRRAKQLLSCLFLPACCSGLDVVSLSIDLNEFQREEARKQVEAKESSIQLAFAVGSRMYLEDNENDVSLTRPRQTLHCLMQLEDTKDTHSSAFPEVDQFTRSEARETNDHHLNFLVASDGDIASLATPTARIYKELSMKWVQEGYGTSVHRVLNNAQPPVVDLSAEFSIVPTLPRRDLETAFHFHPYHLTTLVRMNPIWINEPPFISTLSRVASLLMPIGRELQGQYQVFLFILFTQDVQHCMLGELCREDEELYEPFKKEYLQIREENEKLIRQWRDEQKKVETLERQLQVLREENGNLYEKAMMENENHEAMKVEQLQEVKELHENSGAYCLHEEKEDNEDPFLLSYDASERCIAAEFLTIWFTFLSRNMCPSCTQTLNQRARSVDPGLSFPTSDIRGPCHDDASIIQYTTLESPETVTGPENSIGNLKSCKVLDDVKVGDAREDTVCDMTSLADVKHQDELEEKRTETNTLVKYDGVDTCNNEVTEKKKTSLSRDQREWIRFNHVERKKDFVLVERVKGKRINILQGLELHTGIFSAAEQKRIVECVYEFQGKGKNGELKAYTNSEQKKRMRGKSRGVVIQFGCCIVNDMVNSGSSSGIVRNGLVDPIPHLLKLMIKRLVEWHVIPPSCIPDSCAVNIYDEGDYIAWHMDSCDYSPHVDPIPRCTVSLLSEHEIVFGANMRAIGHGRYSGHSISLPVGSVLVLNGNAANVAEHCLPPVATKRISITFRKMDESKHPFDFVPEPYLEGIQPKKFDSKAFTSCISSKLLEKPVPEEGGYEHEGSHNS